MGFEEPQQSAEPAPEKENESPAPDASSETGQFYWENGELKMGKKAPPAAEVTEPKPKEPVELHRNDAPAEHEGWHPEPPRFFKIENNLPSQEMTEGEFLERNRELSRERLVKGADSVQALHAALEELGTIETPDGIPYAAAEIIAKITDVQDEINNATTPEQVNAAQELLQAITNTYGVRDKVKELLAETFTKKQIEIAGNSIAA